MKIVLYDNQNVILDVLVNLQDLGISGNKAEWAGGGLDGINCNFIAVDDTVAVGAAGSVLPSSVISQDKKANLKTKDDSLQAQINSQSDAINFLLGL